MPSYQLTNAIESGNPAGALEILHRLLTVTSPATAEADAPAAGGGDAAPATTGACSASTTPPIRSAADAIAALGGKVKEFPARKALDQARALGTDGIRQAFDALYQADLDLKGARGIPETAVMEVLVVRLARLAGRSGARRSGRR